MLEKPVKLTMRVLQHPWINATCATSEFPLESLEQPLHLPPPVPEFSILDSGTAYAGIPIKIMFTVTNRKQTPLTDLQIITKLTRDKKVKLSTYGSTIFSCVQANDSITDIKEITINSPGRISLKSEATFRSENAKSSCSTKQTLIFQNPIHVSFQFKGTQVPICEIAIRNQMQVPIQAVRVQVGENLVAIADSLQSEEIATGLVNITKKITGVSAFWEIPGCNHCSMAFPCEKAPEPLGLPARVFLRNVPKLVNCYEPFEASLFVKNVGQVPIEGEMAIVEGGITLFGLNGLMFGSIPPGSEYEVRGTFMATEEGKVKFPQVKVGIKGCPQFYIDVDSGVLVTGKEQ